MDGTGGTGQFHVTPEVLTTTAQNVQNVLEYAQAVVNQYMAHHQDVMVPGSWQGSAPNASYGTAGQIADGMAKAFAGGHRLMDGLNQAAVLAAHNEDDAAHGFRSLFTGEAHSMITNG
jgi:uncharacterized protein YukE